MTTKRRKPDADRKERVNVRLPQKIIAALDDVADKRSKKLGDHWTRSLVHLEIMHRWWRTYNRKEVLP